MSIRIEHGDITKYKGDAIVNSLGTDTEVYGKLCDAIVKADDNPDLISFLKNINGKVKPLDVFVTETKYLTSNNIIHVVTPYRKDDFNHKKYILAYVNALNLAREKHFYRIGVPLIGTGPNGYSHTVTKNIVESLCDAYCKYFPEMSITIFYHGSKTVSDKNKNGIVFDIDVLKDRIMIVKTEAAFGDEAPKEVFTKEFFINPPKINVVGYSEEERTTLLRQKRQDDFHQTIEFTNRTFPKCIFYINTYLDLRYGSPCPDQMDDTRQRIRRLFGGGKNGSSAYGHLGEEIKHSKVVLLKVALGCQMNADETEALLEVYGHSTVSLTNREQAIYAFITQKLYDVEKIENLLKNYYQIYNLYYF